MIGIYVLLFLVMLLIGKFLKGKVKVILALLVVLCCAYCILLNIDMNMVNTLREPIFARENGHMGSMIKYDGLGYKVGLEKDQYSNIIAGQLTILDWYLVQVQAQIDYIIPLEEKADIENSVEYIEKNTDLKNNNTLNESSSESKISNLEDEELDSTIFCNDIKTLEKEDLSKKITEKKAREIAEYGFEESARTIAGEGADNKESEIVKFEKTIPNNYFTREYQKTLKHEIYRELVRTCYVVTRENEMGCGISVYVDATTGLIVGGEAFGD